MAKNRALSLRAQWLGERLRAARERAGHTLQEVGEYLQMRHATVSRFENGIYLVRPSYIRDLITFYGIDDQREREALLRLSEDSWRKDWWDGDTDDLEIGFIDYTWLESRATHIHEYDPLLIPGLLQTENYVVAVMTHGLGDPTPERIRRLTELRVARQHILSGAEPVRLSVILGEGALKRTTGGPEVRQEQLCHLLDLPDHIEVRILPDAISWNPAHQGPFTYFEMPDPYPEVAHIESLVGRTFFEEPRKIAAFRAAYAELRSLALDPQRSLRYIEGMLKEIT